MYITLKIIKMNFSLFPTEVTKKSETASFLQFVMIPLKYFFNHIDFFLYTLF